MDINWNVIYREENKAIYYRRLIKMINKLKINGISLNIYCNKLGIFASFQNNKLLKKYIIEGIFPIAILKRGSEAKYHKQNPIFPRNNLRTINFNIFLFRKFLKINNLEFKETTKRFIIYDCEIRATNLIWNFLNCFHAFESSKDII